MVALTEGVHPDEFIKSVSNWYRSFDNVTIVAGVAVTPGTVLGRVTATGQWNIYSNTGAGGIETAAGIARYAVAAAATDRRTAILARHAEVDGSLLNWGANNPTGITEGTADLAGPGVGIKVRP